jgi:flagellar biosynthetic protein FliP
MRRAAYLLLLLSVPAAAAPDPVLQQLGIAQRGGDAATLSTPMQIAVGLTLLSLLPAFIMCVTPFLRITIVLHFLRQALGTQTAPSNQVLLGLALFLTIPLIQPMTSEMYEKGWRPLQSGTITTEQAVEEVSKPLRHYLVRFAREKDVKLMIEVAKAPAPRTPADLGLSVLIPAFILSELKTGFQIGALLFLPFLIIDLVVASVTLSVGMVQLPPVMLSAPFKILLFVLVDGWNLVIGSLLRSFSA